MSAKNKYAIIITAAGVGSRMKSDIPKQFINVLNKPVLYYTVKAFDSFNCADEIVITASKPYIPYVENMVRHYEFKTQITVTEGGSTRRESVYNGILALNSDITHVLIHDAARPLIDKQTVLKCIESLENGTCCAAGVKVKDTIKLADNSQNIIKTVDRSNLWQIQTPQFFDKESILNAHIYAKKNNIEATDDCMLYEAQNGKIKIIESSYDNFKITTPIDLALFKELVQND